MNNEIKEILDFKENADYKKLSCDEIKVLRDYITNLQQENERLKFYLNDVVFDDNNIDVELSARYLRKLGYIDFDEERQVYVNKHNNQPFMQEDTKEKSFYIKDDELNDYTKQLENKIEKAVEYIEKNKSYWEEWHYDGADIDIESDINYILNILVGVMNK